MHKNNTAITGNKTVIIPIGEMSKQIHKLQNGSTS